MKQVSAQEIKFSVINDELVEIRVSKELINSQKISDELIVSLVHNCDKIQKHFACPQDIEFSIKKDLIYFLQSRPITTLKNMKEYDEK